MIFAAFITPSKKWLSAGRSGLGSSYERIESLMPYSVCGLAPRSRLWCESGQSLLLYWLKALSNLSLVKFKGNHETILLDGGVHGKIFPSA